MPYGRKVTRTVTPKLDQIQFSRLGNNYSNLMHLESLENATIAPQRTRISPLHTKLLNIITNHHPRELKVIHLNVLVLVLTCNHKYTIYNYLNTLWEAVKGSPPRMYEFDDEYFVSLAMKITGDSFSQSMCQATEVAFIVRFLYIIRLSTGVISIHLLDSLDHS